jgi:quercetin dioxygenase-like cupin family protein
MEGSPTMGRSDQQEKNGLKGSPKWLQLEVDAGDAEIAHRRMLAVTGGLAALAAARPTAADAPKLTVPTKRSNETMEIMRIGSRPSGKGPTEYFTGSVRIDPLFQAPDPARVRGASVTFDPGARTAWHTHPLGQTLIVTAGCGWVQREGGPVEEIRPGDVVWFSPGEKHWHGATATTGMTHTALQEALDGKVVDWMEKVSDEQYRR